MKIVIGTDHRGIELKRGIIENLQSEFEIVDMSPVNDANDDFPDFAFKVCHEKLKTDDSIGVLICGSGIGMVIAANKVKGIRCALVQEEKIAKSSRSDDDANVIAFPSTIELEEAIKCIRVFISTKIHEEEKYLRRVKKIIDYENGEYNEL